MTQNTDQQSTPRDPSHTGRSIITLRRSALAAAATSGLVKTLERLGGSLIVLDTLGVVIAGDLDTETTTRLHAMTDTAPDTVAHVEPERWLYASHSDPPIGYSDGVDRTWGLEAIGLHCSSQWNGAGTSIAVLDTGIGHHADLVRARPERVVLAQSFVPDQSFADKHGHGTHCIGTSAGSPGVRGANQAYRYGLASAATILAGKVLSNEGMGMSGWILAGIEWAVRQQATVISMSLGGYVRRGETYSPAYEAAARAALDAGTLIVAAAGNGGDNPVNSPANCPSILAVGALTPRLERAQFSCISINPDGGDVGIAAPGVNVFSSVASARGERYATWSGTSMATPHVAGAAALWAQATGLKGRDLWRVLVESSRRLRQPVEHVGAGCVQVPV